MSPAGWLRRGHPEGLPTLFIDRSLGRIKVPTLLREAGLELVTLAEHYGIPQEENVADVTWLAETAARGWVALGKDERIRRRPAEKAAVRRHGARCFYFTRGDLPAEIYVEAHPGQPRGHHARVYRGRAIHLRDAPEPDRAHGAVAAFAPARAP